MILIYNHPPQPRRFRLIGHWTTPPETSPQQPNSTTTVNLQKTPIDKRVYKI